MNDTNTTAESPDFPNSNGYEREGDDTSPAPAASTPAKKKATRPAKNWDQLKANFLSVFGHGIGKASMLIAIVIIVLFAAIAYRGFKSVGPQNQEVATNVDIPTAPRPQVTIDSVSEKEAERRANQANVEANEALNKGQTYQPGFSPKIGQQSDQQMYDQAGNPITPSSQPGQSGQPGVPANVSQHTAQQAVEVALPANDAAMAASAQAEAQRNQIVIDQQKMARDKYVEEVRRGVKEQVALLLGTAENQSGIRGASRYSTVSYLPTQKGAAGAAQTPTGVPMVAGETTANSNTKPPKYAYRAGRAAYAELDAEVNTDDGGDVIATMRGGAYDGGKLIGKVELAPRNMRLRFMSLTPPDDRPSMTINAVAVREEDAKQGIADSIDNHTVERYASLFVSSTLSGIAKAAAQPQGNVVILPNGQTITQTPELTNRRLAMFALGEVGVAAASEMRKGFDMPPTYKTNAKRGIGVIFLSDVVEK